MMNWKPELEIKWTEQNSFPAFLLFLDNFNTKDGNDEEDDDNFWNKETKTKNCSNLSRKTSNQSLVE